MWFAIAWLTLLPLAWALAGAPPIAGHDPLIWAVLPGQLGEQAAAGWLALLAAAMVGVLLALGPTSRIAVHCGTVVHEVGHALTAAALGGVVRRITMSADGSGMATTGLPGRAWVRGSLVTMAGYLAPGIVGLASLQMALAGLGLAWLGFLAVLALVMLVLSMRSWWAALVALASATAAWLVVRHGSGELATLVAAALGGLLLARGVADAANQYRLTRRGAARTDATSLARETGLPAGFYAAVHQVAAVAMALGGVWLLLPLAN